MVVIRFKPLRTAVTRQGFDAAYIQRLVDEDPPTEANFCEYFGRLIYIKARSRRLSHEEAEDVRQETLRRVLQKVRNGELRSPESLGAYVNSVCNHVLQERYRDRKRHQQPAEEPGPLPDTSSPSPEEEAIAHERQEQVRRLLAEMSPENRRLLTQVRLEERDRSEICRELQVSPGYLRVLIHRAEQELRALHAKRQAQPKPPAPEAGFERQPKPSSVGGNGGLRESAPPGTDGANSEQPPAPGGNGDGRMVGETEGERRTARKAAGNRRSARRTLGL
jgi:RNA polymerase sigma-70 factor (ECF subfamily)